MIGADSTVAGLPEMTVQTFLYQAAPATLASLAVSTAQAASLTVRGRRRRKGPRSAGTRSFPHWTARWAPVDAAMAACADPCQQLGGALEGAGDRQNVLAGDMDGDGIADDVLDTQLHQCRRSASSFCGNGGCQVDIAVRGLRFGPVSAPGGQPTLPQGPRAAEISLWVSGTNRTGLQADQARWITHAWKDGKLVERAEARPRPG